MFFKIVDANLEVVFKFSKLGLYFSPLDSVHSIPNNMFNILNLLIKAKLLDYMYLFDFCTLSPVKSSD